jgi:hypothetical protein
VRRPVCLAVEWVAWAVWTINPTLTTETTKARDSSGPFFLCRSHEIKALKRALELRGDYSVVGVVRHFPRTVDVPAGSTKS